MRLLDKGYLDTDMSTMEVDVLIEIADCEGCSARDIATELHLDKGYLSRMIHGLEKSGLIARVTSDADSQLSQVADAMGLVLNVLGEGEAGSR